MKQINIKKIKDQALVIPGSKSISHRAMICAALCNGRSNIYNLLCSQDILLTMNALKDMGAKIDQILDPIPDLASDLAKENHFTVSGFSGTPKPYSRAVFLGNSGTSIRLLAGIAALGTSEYILTGDKRLCERPMKELLEALNILGIFAKSENKNGTPPVHILGKSRAGGKVKIDCSKSSQYLSSLLIMGPLMKNGLDISLASLPVSSPYIDLTIDIMKKFKVKAYQIDALHFKVPGHQSYIPCDMYIEPDLSNAGYFWAVGAITKSMISIKNISKNSLQGDLKQIRIFEKMGCAVKIDDNQIGVCGSSLKGIDIDMADMPDAVPAIAVVASFAKGKTRIRNIKHLREKECDRIDALHSQLKKMGIKAEQGEDYLEITGGKPKGARIETFNDHRIAMAFSIPGLLIKGMEIENETCVEKSFPDFWDIFEAL